MADIGDIQQNEQGVFKMTAKGWQQLSPEQIQAESTPAPFQFLQGVTGAGPAAGTAGALGTTLGLGSIVAAPLTLGGRAAFKQGSRAIGALGGNARTARVLEQVQNAKRAQADVAAQRLGGGLPVGGATEQQLGNASRSVGAAERNSLFQDVTELFTSPADLTPAQLKAIPEAERLGFKFIPGQIQGSRLMAEGIKSNPILRDAVEFELNSNRDLLQRTAAKAVGITDEALDADSIGLAASRIGAKFDEVRDAIPDIELSGAQLDDIAGFGGLTNKQRRSFGVETKGNSETTLTGKELMEIRSRLNRLAADEWKQGRAVVAEDIGDLIEDMDEQISKVIEDGAMDLWREARQEWRVLRILEKPNVVDLDTGNINFLSARNHLRKDFKSAFGRQQFGKRTGLTQETSDFLDIIRVSGAFKDTIGDSGTAGRLSAVNALLNPREAGKAFIARKLIEREADRLNVTPADLP